MPLTLEEVERLADLKAEGIYIGEATVWGMLAHRFRCLQAEVAEGRRRLMLDDVERLADEFERHHSAALHILKTRFPKGTE